MLLGARRGFRLDGKVVVVTGGSRGLGLALAREIASRGGSLALIARDDVELERAAAGLRSQAEVTTWTCDVRASDSLRSTIARIGEHYGRIDVLINNAGIITVAPLSEMTDADFGASMETHFWGPYHAIMAALPYLTRQNESRIVNIASFGGHIAVPHMAPYCASKFALVGLSDALRTELGTLGVKVTTVSPGLMRVGSHINAAFKGDVDKEFTWFSLGMGMPFLSISAESAARQIVDAVERGLSELTITAQARLAIVFQALFPRLTASVLKLVNHLLPSAGDNGASTEVKGGKCHTMLSPSFLTTLADRASADLNELPASGRLSTS